jgi:hypothetical protein
MRLPSLSYPLALPSLRSAKLAPKFCATFETAPTPAAAECDGLGDWLGVLGEVVGLAGECVGDKGGCCDEELRCARGAANEVGLLESWVHLHLDVFLRDGLHGDVLAAVRGQSDLNGI